MWLRKVSVTFWFTYYIYCLYTGLYNRALARALSLISKNGQERAGCALYSFTDGPPLCSLPALAHKSMHLQVATGRTRRHGGMSWNTNIISHATVLTASNATPQSMCCATGLGRVARGNADRCVENDLCYSYSCIGESCADPTWQGPSMH
jgi:hypothetical protein